MNIFRLKKNFIKSSFFLLLTVASLLVLSNAKTHAVAAPSGANGIAISPPSYELTGNPGDKIENVIKVTSASSTPIIYEALVEDFRVEGQEGQVTVSADDNNPNAFSKWFKIEPTTFALEPKQTAIIKFTITVPKNAEPGGHFASVLFQAKQIESSSSTGAQVLQRIGSLVLMNISGATTESGKVENFSTKTFEGSWENVVNEDTKVITYSPRNEITDKEKPKSAFSSGPIAFDLVLKNEGNVHYSPKGTVTIYNIFGQKVDELQIEPKNVFPGGGERRITVVWPKKNLWGLRYTAKVVALYGTKNQTLTSETSFWAFPTTVGIGIIVGIILIILLRKRIIKAVKVIAKG